MWICQGLIATKHIYQRLNDPFMKLGFLFLNWTLTLLTNELWAFTKYLLSMVMNISLNVLAQGGLRLYLSFLLYILQTPFEKINPNNDEFNLIDSELYLRTDVMDLIKDPKIGANKLRLKDFYR
ncbi:Uncharacterized protein FWK35_00019088, partial [Aphis craccivora]